jgi:hypothetical protein
MRSVMKHNFSEVPNITIPRSVFNRSKGYKTTFDAGYLIPFLIEEIYPADSVKCNVTGFARLSTPIYPIMDNMKLKTFFFFVPHRLVWDNWQKFMGEQIDPGDSTDYTIPVLNVNDAQNETIYDYAGIPTKVAADLEVSALPFRGMYKIYNEWFRDQNLIDSLDVDTDDGPDLQADYELFRRCKEHDYFTSALPWVQKDTADVLVPIGSEAPIFGANMDFDDVEDADNYMQVADQQGANSNLRQVWQGLNGVYGRNQGQGDGALMADLSQATGGTVNALRLAFQTQKILERDARSGSRYIEIVKSHFGVNSPDARLQRPEYLGGGTTPVNISPVAQTDTNVGALGAMGTVAFSNHGFTKSFCEHGYVIGFMQVSADLTYQEGLERHWSRQTKFDFYFPSLANLGEQAILNKEIYVDATDIGNGTIDDVFGYQERFAELRYGKSLITGKLRSNDANSLDAWHLGIEFGDTPTLDADFIKDNPPVDRVIAVPSEPHFIFDSYISMIHTRALPVYGVPGLIDHF